MQTMQTKEFLEAILPRTGKKLLVYGKSSTDHKPTQIRAFDDIALMAKAAEFLSSKKISVYYAVNSFKSEKRNSANVAACRALFDDFDVGPGKNYETLSDAVYALKKFLVELRIMPTVVSSGRGLHVYLMLNEDITPEEWLKLARMKRAIMQYLNVRTDHAVDMDIARILRPVGVYNYKYDKPLEVKLIKMGKSYTKEELEEKFVNFIKVNKLIDSEQKKCNPFQAAKEVEFPPAYAWKIKEQCPTLAYIAKIGGLVREPLWRAMLGLVKFCEDGEKVAEDWSKGDSRYTWKETKAKMDNWKGGPATCEEFKKHEGNRCDSCSFNGKIKSPIVLGYENDLESDTTSIVVEGETIHYWYKRGYKWDVENHVLCKAVKDDDGNIRWRPFCRTFITVTDRIHLETGIWACQLKALSYGEGWRSFIIPASDLASTDTLAKSLASNEVFLVLGKYARSDMAEYLSGLVERLQKFRMQTKVISRFGWVDNLTGFAIGNKIIRAGKEEFVRLSDSLPSDIRNGLGSAGTVEEWAKYIDVLVNRPGAEVLQFALCHIMGSPLVQLMNSATWRGIPLVLSGSGGQGKSTIAQIASTFFGHPKYFSQQGTTIGTTLQAALKRIELMNGLTFVLDEFSDRSVDEVIQIGYALGNGRAKERLTGDGKFATTGNEWYINSIITGNASLHTTLEQHFNADVSEAVSLRSFEVSVPEGYKDKVWPDLDRVWIDNFIAAQHGTAYKPFIQYILNNITKVQSALLKMREQLSTSTKGETKERFYLDAIVTAAVAGKIAKKLGLINFDITNMVKWAITQLENLRVTRKQNVQDPRDLVAQFISSLYGRIIVTKYIGDGRAKTTVEAPIEQLRSPAVARIAIEDKRIFVTISAINNWCTERKIPLSKMRHALLDLGYIVPHNGKPGFLFNIAIGTTIPGTAARCYELNYNAVCGNGVPLHIIESSTKEKSVI